MREVLASVCEHKQPGIVIATEAEEVFPCRFVSVTDQSLTLALMGAASGARFHPLGLCCVTFNTDGRSHVFLAHVRGFDPEAEPVPLLTVRLPARMTVEEVRTATRIPVIPESGLRVCVTTDDSHFREAMGHDLSLSGIQLSFAAEDDPGLADDGEVQVELILGSTRSSLRARVRRRVGLRYGLVFPDAVRDGNVEPPAELRTIVTELEAGYLRSQVE